MPSPTYIINHVADALARFTSLYQKPRPAAAVSNLLAENANVLLTESGNDLITET